MNVNTRTGQGPPPCTNGVDCPEPAPKVEPEQQTHVTASVHIHSNTPFLAVNKPNDNISWLTIGNQGCSLHIEAKDARRLAKALNALALASEHGRVFRAES